MQLGVHIGARRSATRAWLPTTPGSLHGMVTPLQRFSAHIHRHTALRDTVLPTACSGFSCVWLGANLFYFVCLCVCVSRVPRQVAGFDWPWFNRNPVQWLDKVPEGGRSSRYILEPEPVAAVVTPPPTKGKAKAQ